MIQPNEKGTITKMMKANRNQTPLERALQSNTEKPSPKKAFALASEYFAKGQRLDMVQLAESLDVSRATLYRWVGSREALLTEVIWAGARELMTTAEQAANGCGGDFVAQVMTNFVRLAVHQPALNTFLDREGEAAVRLLTQSDSGFQPRVIAWAKDLIDQEVRAEKLSLTLPSEELAFAVVRMGESYIYRRFITGKRPDLSTVPTLMKLLVR